VKLLLLSSEFPPGPGGIGTHAHAIADELHRSGWSVHVVSPQDYVQQDEAAAFRSSSAVEITPIPRRGPLLLRLLSRLRLVRAAVRRQPDVVLASGLTSVWLAALCCRRCPWVAVGHGTEFVSPSRLQSRLNRWAFARAAIVICVSGYTASRLLDARIRPRRLVIIPNGAEDRRFRPDPEAGRRFRASHGLEGIPLVLTVGNVTERKGQDVVVRALAERPDVAAAHYLVVGLPTRAAAIQELAEELGVAERVHLVGRLDATELAAAYNAADVFAMTSRRVVAGDVEGYGIAVVEAALCGKPSVVSGDSGLAEAVEDGATGLVVPQEDARATADALATLLADTDLCKRTGGAALRRAREELTWPALAERYADLLRNATRPPARRLAVVSDTPYYVHGGEFVGWGPNVRELDQLAKLVDEVVHVAPVYRGPAPASALPSRSAKVMVHPVVPAGGPDLPAKLRVLARYPQWARAIAQEVRGAFLIHVRSPSNIALLAVGLFHRRAPAPVWFKYGGNWRPGRGEPWTYRLQRWMLARLVRTGPVTVNGEWVDDPSHVHAFRNPTLTPEELDRGRAASAKRIEEPVRLVFAGRLDRAKGANRCVEIAALLHQRGRRVHLDVAGDGPQAGAMAADAAAAGIEGAVTFHGWLSRGDLESLYAAAHLLLLPTDSEGFPKVISEAMAFGVVPLAGAVSNIPQALADMGTGRALAADDVTAFADAVEAYLDAPHTWASESRRGVAEAEVFAYDGYLREVSALALDAWDLELGPV